MSDLIVGADGEHRCAWPGEDRLYLHYHDEEWGRAVTDDDRLFEKLVLEGFQAGLSWITILRKRARFREVFGGFVPGTVAAYGDTEIEALLADAGIIRHRGKIEAAISNAARAIEMQETHGSLAAFFWPRVPKPRPAPATFSDLPAQTEESAALSKELKALGWRFVGPTTVYAFMQAMGLVGDHLKGCFVREECEAGRAGVLARYAV